VKGSEMGVKRNQLYGHWFDSDMNLTKKSCLGAHKEYGGMLVWWVGEDHLDISHFT
jgi:hypothetical protein